MTLKESDGIDLSEISPHSSDNFHIKLYATMLGEYALGTTWHNRTICDGLQNAETYLLLFEHIVPMCIDKMEQNQEISISFEVKTENNKIEDCRDDQPSIKE